MTGMMPQRLARGAAVSCARARGLEKNSNGPQRRKGFRRVVMALWEATTKPFWSETAGRILLPRNIPCKSLCNTALQQVASVCECTAQKIHVGHFAKGLIEMENRKTVISGPA